MQTSGPGGAATADCIAIAPKVTTTAIAPYIHPSVFFMVPPLGLRALLRRERGVYGGLDLGLGLVDLRMPLAFLDLGGEGGRIPAFLGDVLERRADLLLVGLVAVGASAGLEGRILGGHDVGKRPSRDGERGEED